MVIIRPAVESHYVSNGIVCGTGRSWKAATVTAASWRRVFKRPTPLFFLPNLDDPLTRMGLGVVQLRSLPPLASCRGERLTSYRSHELIVTNFGATGFVDYIADSDALRELNFVFQAGIGRH